MKENVLQAHQVCLPNGTSGCLSSSFLCSATIVNFYL